MNETEKREIAEKMNRDARAIADQIASWGCLGDRVRELAEGMISADRELALLELSAADEQRENARGVSATEYAGKYKILPEKLRGGPLETLFGVK